ncbi:TPA: beta keto-acyl synthase, partial [Burkholderia cepacia]|nr:beta keto-acyl synthase [Burkholderia cepacia]
AGAVPVQAVQPVPAPVAAPVGPGTLLPGALRRTGVAADGEPLGVARYRIEWRDAPWRPAGRSTPFIAPRCVIVTDLPEALAAQADPGPGCVVLSTRPFAASRPGWHWIERIDETVLAGLPDDIGHVRVLTSLDAGTLAPGAAAPAAPARLALHDLAFLAIKHCHAALKRDGSFVVLLLDALAGEAPHPDAGLYTGLVKALAIEMPEARPVAVLTDARSLPDALRDAERESGAQHWL